VSITGAGDGLRRLLCRDKGDCDHASVREAAIRSSGGLIHLDVLADHFLLAARQVVGLGRSAGVLRDLGLRFAAVKANANGHRSVSLVRVANSGDNTQNNNYLALPSLDDDLRTLNDASPLEAGSGPMVNPFPLVRRRRG
jgi:hypothetical protein